MGILEVSELVAGYDGLEIVRGVSLHVDPGEMVAIIGPNGSGKSTLLKAIVGLADISKGRVSFAGQDITYLRSHQTVALGLAYTPQVENIFPSLTVEENLEMGGYLHRAKLRDNIARAYDLFPALKTKRRAQAGQLSGGQRQMLALARILMVEPKAVLLDEPSAGLSPYLMDLVFEKVTAIQRSGISILIVEQNAYMALSLSARAYVLAMGRSVWEGATSDLLKDADMRKLYLGKTE
jgi:ABC-type branched-subunit amino acid transport system ATPase component